MNKLTPAFMQSMSVWEKKNGYFYGRCAENGQRTQKPSSFLARVDDIGKTSLTRPVFLSDI